MSDKASDKKTSELLKCPFCDTPLKKIGSERRGTRRFVHEYMKSDCILKEFGFKASEENFERWNTRIPMHNIVERLEEEKSVAGGHEIAIFGARCAYEIAIEIVRECNG